SEAVLFRAPRREIGHDLFEARIAAQSIPNRVETEFAVGWTGWDFHNNLELLNREVALASQCIDQRQITDGVGTSQRILANRHEFDRVPCFADGLFFPAKPGINSRDFTEVALVLGLARLRGL